MNRLLVFRLKSELFLQLLGWGWVTGAGFYHRLMPVAVLGIFFVVVSLHAFFTFNDLQRDWWDL